MYEIKYAYPSSVMARQLKRNGTGCFYVEIRGVCAPEPFDTLETAAEFAESTGYTPSKDSLDVFGLGVNPLDKFPSMWSKTS